MQQARLLGNYVAYLVSKKNIDLSVLCSTLNCSEEQMKAFFKGRMLLSFSQLSDLAKYLNVSVNDLLMGDDQHYNATVVHCMNNFDDNDNRELILDLIDDYMDILDAVPVKE